MPLTVDFVSLLLGVRQACADCGIDLRIVALAHAGPLEFEPVCTVNDAVQDRVADCVALVREWIAIQAFILTPSVTSSERKPAYPDLSFD